MGKETRYEAIKRLEYYITYFMKLGLVPVTIKNWLDIYEKYKNEYNPEITKTENFINTSIVLNVSEKTVRRVVNFMSEECNKHH